MSNGRVCSPAINREVVELFFMEEFHWLPQDIAKIPYKKIQKIFILRNQRTHVMETKQGIEEVKRGFNKKTR